MIRVFAAPLEKIIRIENQEIYPARERYDLSEQLVQCILSFEDRWEEKEIELEADIPDEIHFTADQELLSIVWNNLLSNAVKFTPKGGSICVRLSRDGGHVKVEVTDTGCGMDEDTQKHIFEKFYQGDKSHATMGNGLGLALVKRIVDIYGGQITVDSKPGEGSTFTVIL